MLLKLGWQNKLVENWESQDPLGGGKNVVQIQWQSHLPFNVKVFIWTVAGDYLYELLCEDKVFLLKCVCFAQFQGNIVINLSTIYQLSNGKGYLEIYIYSVGFYKQHVKILVSMDVW